MPSPSLITLEQAWQQAIDHHQGGRLQEAERVYRAILSHHPTHPDAHHNLGVLLLQTGQAAAGALTHLKTALEANPGQGQHWSSYIEALLQTGQPEVAGQVLAQGRRHGWHGEAVERLEARARQWVEQKERLITLFHQQRHPEMATLARHMTERFPGDGWSWKMLGVALKPMGQVVEARVALEKAATIVPEDADVHDILGVILQEQGRPIEAEVRYRLALSIQPDRAATHNNLGNALKDQGRLDEAEASFRQALRIRPEYARALANLGVLLQERRQFAPAEAHYRQALRIQPDHAETHYNLGTLLHALHRNAEAEAAYRQALFCQPDHALAHSNLGALLRESGRHQEAVAAYRQAVRCGPDQAVTYSNLGHLLKEMGCYPEAETACRQALALQPDHAPAHNNLGVLLQEMKRFPEAEAAFREAVRLQPDDGLLHNNLGILLQALQRGEEAEAAFRQALRLLPDHADIASNLGFTLTELGRQEEAIDCFHRAIRLGNQPDAHYSNLILSSSYTVEDDAALFALCRAFGRRLEAVTPRLSHTPSPFPDKRLRIGYVSGDFRRHAVAYFIEPILEHHDPRQIELFCYHNATVEDEVTRRIQNLVHHWRPIATLSDEQAAAMIQQDGIDILVDLSGHTAMNRLPLFARKPAPVQATWIGCPQTTGLTTMDYRLTNPLSDPPGWNEPFHTETLVHLPSGTSFSPRERLPDIASLPAIRNGYPTFASFHHPGKITANMLTLWSRILTALPAARLILCPDSSRQQIQRHLTALGIPAKRVTFYKKRPVEEYYRLHNEVDIGLDTFPYNGGTISKNMLWMGVPFVTLAGRRSMARKGLKLLTQLDLPSFIAQSGEEYVQHAIRHANDLEALSGLRQTLRDRMRAAPFSDARQITGALEEAYRRMWTTWCAQRP